MTVAFGLFMTHRVEYQLVGIAGGQVRDLQPVLRIVFLPDRAAHLLQNANHFLLEQLPRPAVPHQIRLLQLHALPLQQCRYRHIVLRQPPWVPQKLLFQHFPGNPHQIKAKPGKGITHPLRHAAGQSVYTAAAVT